MIESLSMDAREKSLRDASRRGAIFPNLGVSRGFAGRACARLSRRTPDAMQRIGPGRLRKGWDPSLPTWPFVSYGTSAPTACSARALARTAHCARAPLISAASFTAVLTGSSASSRRSTRSPSAASGSLTAGAPETMTTNSPRRRFASSSSQARASPSTHACTFSKALVNSRASTIARVSPSTAARSCTHSRMRCGAS